MSGDSFMDNDTFTLLSQVIVKGRALAGAIHPVKLISEPAYAEEVFQKIEQSDDESLIMLSLQLRQKLGQLEASTLDKKTAQDQNAEQPQKYLYGARG